MKDYSGYNAPLSLSISRFTSSNNSSSSNNNGDKAGSDSGISSRGSSSGSSDERSGSRSSALSGLDENLPSSHHQQQQQPPPQPPYLHPHHLQQHQGPPSSRDKSPPTAIGVSGGHSVIAAAAAAAAADRYYLHHPASLSGHHPPPGAVLPLDAVRVWRDHSGLSLSLIDPTIRHVDSVQHQPLLMSHPAVGVGSSPSSSASVAAVSPPSVAVASSTPNAHYPQPSAIPSMISQAQLQHQLPPHLYGQMPDVLWKQRGFAPGLTASQLHSVMQGELLEQERAYAHDRDRHERQDRQLREQEREVEKHKEREKQREREKIEKDRLEKQRAEQAVKEHFSKAQTLGYKKSSGWNFLPTSSAPNSNSFRMNDDDRKRMIEQEQQQRMIRPDLRDRDKMTGLPAFTPYAPPNLQMPKSTTATPVPSNSASTPPNAGGSTAAVIQNRVKSQMSLPKSESMYSVYGYPPFPSPLNLYPSEKMMKNSVAMNSIVPNKSSSAMDRELLMSGAHPHGVQPLDMKNSVIVKNDGKSHAQMAPTHLLSASDVVLKSGGGSLVAGTAATTVMPSHSPNPKARLGEPPQQHYLQLPPGAGKPQYEYRSPSQSPHITNATSPHQLLVDPMKMHHRPSSSPAGVPPSSHHRQSPLPLTQSRQSPQTHHRQSPQTHHRQSPLPANQPPVQLAPHQRHSPHLSSTSSRTSSPPEQRYVSVASPNTAGLYQKAPIPHPAVGVSSAAYLYPSSLSSVTSMATPVKPKVSSPAPAQFYGKPTSGISTGTPVCRPQEVSINTVPINTKGLITPSPYQQLSQHQMPPSTIVPTHQNLDPPPAHSSHLTSVVSDSLSFFGGASGTGGPVIQRHTGAADLTASGAAAITAAAAAVTASSLETTITVVPSAATAALPSQMQPLDLGIKESTAAVGLVAPTELTKRKLVEEDESSDQPTIKRIHVDVVPEVSVVPPTPTPSTAPPADEAAEQNPLVAAIVSAASAPATVEPPPPSLTPVLPEETSVVAPPPPCSSPSTPAKLAPSNVDGEKSNSPKPPSYGGHKLKKAWLQRHSGEDISDEKASGSSISSAVKSLDGSLSINENDGNVPTNGGSSTNADRAVTSSPLSSSTTVTKEAAADNATSNPLTSLNNSLNSIGSMAVNSISKVKQPKGGAAGKKGSAKDSRASPLVPNGHLSPKVSGGTNSDESSSTDTDTKASPKRVPPKLKRKKHGTPRKTSAAAAAAAAGAAADTPPKRKKLNSTSSTDSDKESASEKDSEDNSNSTAGSKKTASGNGGDEKKDNSRKRGRKPKMPSDGYATGNGSAGGAAGGGASSNGNGSQKDDDAPKEKKMREDPREQKDPFPKPSISHLKKTGESFLQDGPCFEVAPKLAKCRECRWTQNQRSKSNSNIFCRFYAFRRLRYTKNGQLAIAGFSDPYRDAKHDDLNLWLPNSKNPPTDLDLEVARFTLLQVGDQFCDLLMQEADAININLSEDKKIAWKRVVQGVREMCDVCETTLFNFHWACSKCGFVVCIDCYKGRKNGTVKIWGESGKDRDDLSWLLCTNRQPHEQEKLMLTQIIAGDALMKLLKSSHDTRAMWEMALNCGCPLAANPKPPSDVCRMIMRNLKQEKMKKAEQMNGQVKTENGTEESAKNETDSPLNWLADVALNQNKSSADDDGDSSDDSEEGSFSTLRELLIRPASKTNGNNSQPSSPNSSASAATTSTAASTSTTTTTSSTSSSTTSTTAAGTVSKTKPKKTTLDSFNEMLSSVGGECHDDNGDDFVDDRFANNGDGVALKYFVRDHMRKQYRSQGHCPIRIMTLSESKLLYPDVPHSWLCDGKLLRLLDAGHSGNYTIFQDQWRRGQPVIVSEVTKLLSKDLWHPDSFIRDFGDVKNDLINCMTGKIVPNQPMRKFWEGFEYLSRRLKDDKGNDMLLKLKDWPPGEDFAEMLPSRFNDLMSVLPLSEYTQRSGRLNLASRLPECFVRPDLGPKMYNAYGSAMHPNKGTTNLHLDISDAVNVMVYVGIPKDGENEEHIKEAYRAIDEAGCDILTRRRVREKGELPGALWHIYAARDADKIRDLLNKVAIERGDRLEPNHDPIHDQSCYLDGPLRERLFKEYAVEGYAIVQCMGDAVFVPAGAPHQVRNLHNCIKVAEDFVSPENVSHCFHLTQEFRYLSDTHSNHEDKLQNKNIMYHAVKDSLSVMGAELLKYTQKAKENSNTGGAGAGDDSTGDVKPAVKVEPKSES